MFEGSESIETHFCGLTLNLRYQDLDSDLKNKMYRATS